MAARDPDMPVSGDEDAPQRIGVLIVDPSPFSRACTVEGLRAAPEFALDACAAIPQCDPALRPDLLLFQPGEDQEGTALFDQLELAARRWPGAANLVVADHPSLEEAIATIRAGAQGLLASNTTMACMRAAMLLLVNGIGVYPPAIADFLRRGESLAAPGEEASSAFGAHGLDTLTKRQGDVLQLLARGFSNKAIARQLEISESTVKVHIRAIMSQNGVSNRTQVVAHFLKRPSHED